MTRTTRTEGKDEWVNEWLELQELKDRINELLND